LNYLEGKNKLIFDGGNCKSIRAIGNSIISLAKYWSLRQNDEFQTKLHLILSYFTFRHTTITSEGVRKPFRISTSRG
jgi:hypothetical protein